MSGLVFSANIWMLSGAGVTVKVFFFQFFALILKKSHPCWWSPVHRLNDAPERFNAFMQKYADRHGQLFKFGATLAGQDLLPECADSFLSEYCPTREKRCKLFSVRVIYPDQCVLWYALHTIINIWIIHLEFMFSNSITAKWNNNNDLISTCGHGT